jgi:hypothetical protein
MQNLYSESIFSIHKLVKYLHQPLTNHHKGEQKQMEKALSSQERKRLQKIMMKVLINEIQDLPPELRYVLTDDLVTALQNRLTVLHRINQNRSSAK